MGHLRKMQSTIFYVGQMTDREFFYNIKHVIKLLVLRKVKRITVILFQSCRLFEPSEIIDTET